MTETVTSVNGSPVRLTDERWSHITEEHSELAGFRFEILETLAAPESVFRGTSGELLATREIETGKWLVVIYRETNGDGFIITAFLTRRIRTVESRELIWSASK